MSLKLTLENTLQKIDNFFSAKSKKDTNMIYIMLIAVIFAVVYPLYDFSFDKFSETKEKVDSVSGKIAQDKAFLTANPETKISKLDSDIAKNKKEHDDLVEANAYIKEKIYSISSLVYNEKAWGEYLDSISLNALKHNVKILNFNNKYVSNDESFGHVLDISLDTRASYENTLKFIASLEQSNLVVDLHNFKISAKDHLDANLNISVWGITYQ
ncbi:MAG: type 4a pilus biogenesis protein PilO [Sulfurimonas sp.]|jgi:hypothetical protein|nr:type 4a pilus biogenesis protein PilO [Sulfurimonadaceae bacterium]